MAPPRFSIRKTSALAGLGMSLILVLSGCSDRLEPPDPIKHQEIEKMEQWAAERADPYGIPQRALQAYAYAAYAVEKEDGCSIGWPTIAALGAVLTNHGRHENASINEDGKTTLPLRAVAPAAGGKDSVPDTDGGDIDGDSTQDIPVGPMQLMPSRWEQYGVAVEPGDQPNPDQIDDAALTTAKILCTAGDLSTPEVWLTAMSEFNPHHVFLKAVYDKAEEYSR